MSPSVVTCTRLLIRLAESFMKSIAQSASRPPTRPAVKKSRAGRRLLQQAQALAMPKVAGLATLLADIDKETG